VGKILDSKKNVKTERCANDVLRSISVSWLLLVAPMVAALLFSLPVDCLAADSALAIVDAGVQQSEDAPFVSPGFRFLPGDYLYFTFQISGFAIQSTNRGEIRKISLSYEVRPEDANGVPLTPSSTDAIDAELTPEDKHYTPKRRVSFLLPGFLTAGEFHIHVIAKDLLAKSETSKDFPFRIGGLELKPATTLTLENFRFLRKESDEEGLEVAAFTPGDTVYARFEIVGFKTDAQNAYRLSYGVTVLRPDGKPYLQEPKAAELADKNFYPAQYLPGDLNVTTSATSARGQYILLVTVHDLLANTTYQAKKVFSIE
jgi:hypothetical protein